MAFDTLEYLPLSQYVGIPSIGAPAAWSGGHFPIFQR
jgi:hypothetical protein